MSSMEESLDEKIARIRKQNEAIIERQKLIQEDIKNAQKNNAIVKLKVSASEDDCDEDFGPTLYSDKLNHETKINKSTRDDVWEEKPKTRRNVPRNDKEDEWREERKRIDEERIRRQKANSGSWKREWDADKIASRDEHDTRERFRNNERFTRNTKNERPDNRTNRNFNEVRRDMNETNDNDIHNRWKNNKFNQKPDIDRSTNDAYANRKPNRADGWNSNTSETDKYNNNGSKLDLRSRISRNPINQNRSFSHAPKNDQNLDKNWVKDKKPESTENTEPVLIEKHAPSGRPVAMRGNKWNRDSDIQTKDRSLSLNQSPPSVGTVLKHEKMDKEGQFQFTAPKTNTIIPNDLKNIVIHVKNSVTKSDGRKVEVKNPVNRDIQYLDNSNVKSIPRNVEINEYPSSYATMTFERSDLKPRKPCEDITSQTSIMTQMFSNSKISDFNQTIPSTNPVSQYDISNIELYPSIQSLVNENSPNLWNFQAINDESKNTQNVKIIRTIKNENIVVIKDPNRVIDNDAVTTSTKAIVKNMKAEVSLEDGEIGDEDEWEDVTDDEWEEVSDEDA